MPQSLLHRLIWRRARRLAEPLHERLHRRAVRSTIPQPARVSMPLSGTRDDPRWYPGGTPPRAHNHVTPLIDGERYFTALQEALAGAQAYVYIIGWCITPDLPLARRQAEDLVASRIKVLLNAVARRLPVRILLWSGAPFFFQPDTQTMAAARDALLIEPGVDLQCRLDRSAHFSHCHHQKAIVVDGQVAFVGGMDITGFQGDRWDTPAHPLRAGTNWHDAMVRIEGEAVADVEANFRQRWEAVTGERDLPHGDPVVKPSWRTPVQIARTIARQTYGFAPDGEYGIHHLYTRILRGAERLIYLENQYLWSDEIVAAIVAAMNRRRTTPFRVVIVLPASAYDGKWDNDRQVTALREADNGRGIVSVYCPYASGPNAGTHAFSYRPVYVHAKVAVVDDEWLVVGSANLNLRGLVTDSEIVAAMRDGDLARRTRIDLWTEHLGLPHAEVAAADPIGLIDGAWTARATENATIVKTADRPLLGHLHRYEVGRMPGSWFLEEGQSLVVEH
jgi:phosphatidylserine/phosphatidylglycerophosphate/cardiolipin synthase-like enzyme